jgi:sodium/proline symporter
MMFALVVAPIVVIYELNGLSNTLNIIETIDPALSNWTKGMTLIDFLSLQAWGLGYFGQPHILVRFMAIDNVKSVKAARRIGMSWMLICLFGALVTGFAGIAYFHGRPDELAKLATNSEAIFILITQVAFNPWIAGFLLAAILAAITVERNCGRLEWAVLDWNKPAIDFYISQGAIQMEGWTTNRVTAEALVNLAKE